MKNKGLAALEPLIGEWEYTIYNAWFLESMDTKIVGKAVIERLHDSFVVIRSEADGETESERPMADIWVIGYSDPQEKYQLFYYDQRGVARIFDMHFDGNTWSFFREDEDFYQRFTAQIAPNKIQAFTEASEDKGTTWRKDFDMTYIRKSE